MLRHLFLICENSTHRFYAFIQNIVNRSFLILNAHQIRKIQVHIVLNVRKIVHFFQFLQEWIFFSLFLTKFKCILIAPKRKRSIQLSGCACGCARCDRFSNLMIYSSPQWGNRFVCSFVKQNRQHKNKRKIKSFITPISKIIFVHTHTHNIIHMQPIKRTPQCI